MIKRLSNLPIIPPKRSNLRGTIFGFLIGITACGLWTKVYLLDKYTMYQSFLKSHMDQLSESRNDQLDLKRDMLKLKLSLLKFEETCTRKDLNDQKTEILGIIVY